MMLQDSMDVNLCPSEPHFVFQITPPPNIGQKWFCIQNLRMDLSFQFVNPLHGLQVKAILLIQENSCGFYGSATNHLELGIWVGWRQHKFQHKENMCVRSLGYIVGASPPL